MLIISLTALLCSFCLSNTLQQIVNNSTSIYRYKGSSRVSVCSFTDATKSQWGAGRGRKFSVSYITLSVLLSSTWRAMLHLCPVYTRRSAPRHFCRITEIGRSLLAKKLAIIQCNDFYIYRYTAQPHDWATYRFFHILSCFVALFVISLSNTLAYM